MIGLFILLKVLMLLHFSCTCALQQYPPPKKRIVLASLGLLGHAVPLARIGAELAVLCCERIENCIVDMASHSNAKLWWEEETSSVKSSECLGNFVDLGNLPSDWGEKLEMVSQDPSLFRGTLSVFTDLYLETFPQVYFSIKEHLKQASLVVSDLGTIGAIEGARSLNIPLIIHSPTIWADAFSQFEHAHWLPAFASGFRKEMSLTERCLNALLPRLLSVALQPALMKVNKFRFEAGLDPHPSSHQVFQDVRTLSATAFGFDYPRLVSSMHAFVGPIIPKVREELSNDTFSFVSGYSKVIAVRFGSFVRLEDSATRSLKLALEQFSSRENSSVIWFDNEEEQKPSVKLPNFRFEKKTHNIRQHLSVLAHYKTVLSISHCGMASIQEAIFFSVPVLCIPLVADQSDVAARLMDTKAGLVIHRESLSDPQRIFKEINELVYNLEYSENARKLRNIFRLSGGRRRAAYHILDGFYSNDHLLVNRTISWQKRIGLDVFVFSMGCVCSIGFIFSVIVRWRRFLREGFY